MNVLALVTLQLDDLAKIRVFDDGAVTGKLLLDDLEDFLLVEATGQALDGRQGLAAVTLLDTNVDVVLGLLGSLGANVGLLGIGEGVDGLEVLDGRHRWRG